MSKPKMIPMRPSTARLQALVPFQLAFSPMNLEISHNFLMSDNCSVTRDLHLLSFPVGTLFVRVILLVKVISASDIFSIKRLGEPSKKIENEHEFFERLYPRTGKKRAIVGVARKLIGRLRAAFKIGKPYRMNPITLPA